MPNARNKSVDTTYLSLEKAAERGFIHRDYLAHCLRWSHVVKRVTPFYKEARVLDVGCGRELPLAKTLYSQRLTVQEYVGVDVGPINQEAIDVFKSGKFALTVLPKTDVINLSTDKKFNVVTCFEVFEHVEPDHGVRLLRKLKDFLDRNDPRSRLYLSTPCFDPKMGPADNHVNEMTYRVLGALLEKLGFNVEGVWGTFASIKDYEPHLTDDVRNLFEELRAYYDVNYLATVFAPLFPEYSRNCLWELSTYNLDRTPPQFEDLELQDTPWGQGTEMSYAKMLDEVRRYMPDMKL